MFTNTIKQSVTLLAALILIIPSGAALADSLDVEVTQGAFIYDADSSDARLVLEFAMPAALDSARIHFAELRVPITSVIPDSSILTVFCRPVLVAWDPENVTWEIFGDFPDSSVVTHKGAHFGTAKEGPLNAYFDISRIVQKWQDGSLVRYGLMFYVDPHGRARFAFQRQNDAPFAVVHIDYESTRD